MTCSFIFIWKIFKYYLPTYISFFLFISIKWKVLFLSVFFVLKNDNYIYTLDFSPVLFLPYFVVFLFFYYNIYLLIFSWPIIFYLFLLFNIRSIFRVYIFLTFFFQKVYLNWVFVDSWSRDIFELNFQTWRRDWKMPKTCTQ